MASKPKPLSDQLRLLEEENCRLRDALLLQKAKLRKETQNKNDSYRKWRHLADSMDKDAKILDNSLLVDDSYFSEFKSGSSYRLNHIQNCKNNQVSRSKVQFTQITTTTVHKQHMGMKSSRITSQSQIGELKTLKSLKAYQQNVSMVSNTTESMRPVKKRKQSYFQKLGEDKNAN